MKILTQITLEDGNEPAEIREVFPKKLTNESDSTMTTNLPLPFAVFFFTRTNEGKMETTSRIWGAITAKIQLSLLS